MRSGRADPAKPATRDALRFVACGQPLPGHEIRIVDATGHELGDRREGRIEFRGPSATAGYFHNPDATRSLFHDDWLDTGDLGYLADADLYVTGRIKDIIIRAGRNLHPDELEEAVGNLAGVRKGCVAVFACPDPGGGAERLVVMAETRATDDEATDRVALRDRRRRRWICSAWPPTMWSWRHRAPSRRPPAARSAGPPAARSTSRAGSVPDRGRCGGSWLASGCAERCRRCAAPAARWPRSRSLPTRGCCSRSSRCR